MKNLSILYSLVICFFMATHVVQGVEAMSIPVNITVDNSTSIVDSTSTELLGVATTSIKGSSLDRKANILLGVKRINNKVIVPGEEFSLLASLRPFSKEAGFKEERVIGSSSSPMELGGGLCQISTTLFRSVLQAGLPVTKRQSHSYVVGYYGAGLDATVYFPKTDFRFINNYSKPIIIKAELKGNVLKISFYGIKDTRIVNVGSVVIIKEYPKPKPKTLYTSDITFVPLGDKKCTEKARKGKSTKVLYQVVDNLGVSTSTTFYSYYRPWAEVCYIGVTEEEKQKKELEQSTLTLH